MSMTSRHRRRGLTALALSAVAATALAACGSSAGSSSSAATGSSSSGGSSAASTKALKLAYLPFTVANSYEAPMLAAAKAAAKAGNASITVLSADNDPQKQFQQLQTALSTGQYDGIIVQPIQSTGLTSLVTQAISKGLKVVTMDQILGPDLTKTDPQVTGLSASIVFNPTTIGTKLGTLTVNACQSKNLDPCNVGYLYDLKASSLDVAIRKAFDTEIAKTPSVKVVGEGEDFYTAAKGLSATQNLLQAHSDINLIAASDQGIEGAVQAVASAGKTGKVLLAGYGGSVAGIKGVASGSWYGTVVQLPASEGKQAVEALIAAIRTGKVTGGADPSAAAPDSGIITKANAAKFTGEWPG